MVGDQDGSVRKVCDQSPIFGLLKLASHALVSTHSYEGGSEALRNRSHENAKLLFGVPDVIIEPLPAHEI